VSVVVPTEVVDSIVRLIEQEAGLAFPDHRRTEIEESIHKAASASGTADLAEFVRRIEGDPRLREDLAAKVTIGETYFMRDLEQFEVLREVVLPELIAAHGADLRIWSAGCSTGEEPYSLAIVLAEMGARLNWPITATDINRAVLERAARATYGEWSFRGVDPALRARYFTPEGKRFRVRDELRQSVRFDWLNLATPDYPSLWSGIAGMHLIVCRNVLIYFTPRAIGSVAGRLHASLANDGWLMLGASDPQLAEHAPLESRDVRGRLLYRRRSELAAPAAPSTVRAAAASESTPERRRTARVRPPRADAELQPNDVLKIRALADAGLHREAADLAAAASARAPLDAELQYLSAAICLERGQNEEAAAIARRALYLDPRLSVAAILLGNALRRSGQLRSAGAAYRSAAVVLARMPKDETVPLGDGECAGGLLRTVEALMSLVAGTSP
jgi:chemotaxis protein methyltransferase CheR